MNYTKYSFMITSADGNADLVQAACDIFCNLVAEVGFESFEETDNGIDGYIPADLDNRDAIDAVIAGFPIDGIIIEYTGTEVKDENWNRVWESEGFEPICVAGRCVIHDMLHALPKDIDKDVVEIIIDTEQAFGTGTHETTYMIVEHILSMNMSGKSVLDCGCGTGILSIVASEFGAKSVTGYDIDEWSVRNS
ncbi:MAG: 50S ribosomal protein L11 methyltransferase, partial [Prevotella sp.]